MKIFSGLARRLERRRRMNAYLSTRVELDQFTEGDLADIGIKRFQLGHVARVRSFRMGP